MNRTSLIVIGIMIILCMLGMWVYLLIYGAPKEATDVFTNLGVTESTEEVRTIPAQNNATEETKLALSNAQLQQITDRSVAGFGFPNNTPDTITYMEKGTGHVYTVNTQKGTELLTSAATIQKAAEATFSPDGTSFVATVYDGYDTQSRVGIIVDSTKTTLSSLPKNAENIAFKDTNTILFTQEDSGSTIAYTYSIDSITITKLFSIGFIDIQMRWGIGVDSMYVVTKPAATLIGYVYKVNATGVLTPLVQTGYGLQMHEHGEYTITSESENGAYITEVTQGQNTARLPITLLAEKCASDAKNSASVWCAAPIGQVSDTYLEDWYKGSVISKDHIWYTTLDTQSATLFVNLEEVADQTIDVGNLKTNNTGTLLLFSNKIDDTLWMYKIE